MVRRVRLWEFQTLAGKRAEPKIDPRSASEIDRHIGARIRARRLELGQTQEELAQAIGVTFQQVQKYERGINRVAAATLHRIAHVLNIQMSALMPKLTASAEASSLDDPNVAEVVSVLIKLNPEGRKLLLEMARTIAAHQNLTRRK